MYLRNSSVIKVILLCAEKQKKAVLTVSFDIFPVFTLCIKLFNDLKTNRVLLYYIICIIT